MDKKGELLFGTTETGVYTFNGKTFTKMPFQHSGTPYNGNRVQERRILLSLHSGRREDRTALIQIG